MQFEVGAVVDDVLQTLVHHGGGGKEQSLPRDQFSSQSDELLVVLVGLHVFLQQLHELGPRQSTQHRSHFGRLLLVQKRVFHVEPIVEKRIQGRKVLVCLEEGSVHVVLVWFFLSVTHLLAIII